MAIAVVRNWLRSALPSIGMPGGETIGNRYDIFRKELSSLCHDLHLSTEELTFVDYTWLIDRWLRKNPLWG
jgi:hypothetical protein